LYLPGLDSVKIEHYEQGQHKAERQKN
jgi:hypothetical protein